MLRLLEGASERESEPLVFCVVHMGLIRDVLAWVLQLGECDVPRADNRKLQTLPSLRQLRCQKERGQRRLVAGRWDDKEVGENNTFLISTSH